MPSTTSWGVLSGRAALSDRNAYVIFVAATRALARCGACKCARCCTRYTSIQGPTGSRIRHSRRSWQDHKGQGGCCCRAHLNSSRWLLTAAWRLVWLSHWHPWWRSHFRMLRWPCLAAALQTIGPHSQPFWRATAALPGGPLQLQLCMCLGSRHSPSAGHTAALPGGPRRLQPRMCLSARHSRGAVPISVPPSVHCVQQLHRCANPSDSPAPVPTAALPDALLWLRRGRSPQLYTQQDSEPSTAGTAIPQLRQLLSTCKRSKSTCRRRCGISEAWGLIFEPFRRHMQLLCLALTRPTKTCL